MINSLRVFILFLATLSLSAEARMYQWTDSETGTTQLSGKPPAWYRSGDRGPRIFVFESGQLVDDTGIRVSEEQRDRLREDSLAIANEESIREKAKSVLTKREKNKSQKSESDDLVEELEALEEVEEDIAEVQIDEEEQEITAEDLSGLTIDDMKKLIGDWEQTQRDKALEIINQ